MKDIFLPILIAIVGVSGLLYGAYQTADVKGYTDNHSCFGECYEEYTAKYGTFSEQLEAKRVAMQMESPADKGAKIYVNCNMCHGQNGEGGIGPKLAGSTSIVSMSVSYTHLTLPTKA